MNIKKLTKYQKHILDTVTAPDLFNNRHTYVLAPKKSGMTYLCDIVEKHFNDKKTQTCRLDFALKDVSWRWDDIQGDHSYFYIYDNCHLMDESDWYKAESLLIGQGISSLYIAQHSSPSKVPTLIDAREEFVAALRIEDDIKVEVNV